MCEDLFPQVPLFLRSDNKALHAAMVPASKTYSSGFLPRDSTLHLANTAMETPSLPEFAVDKVWRMRLMTALVPICCYLHFQRYLHGVVLLLFLINLYLYSVVLSLFLIDLYLCRVVLLLFLTNLYRGSWFALFHSTYQVPFAWSLLDSD
jgi:hypothetical protein